MAVPVTWRGAMLENGVVSSAAPGSNWQLCVWTAAAPPGRF
jgi:hypothetical protein